MEQGKRTSTKEKEFVEHVKNLHEEVHAHITKMNLHYKARENQKRRNKKFYIWDLVMVYLKKE